MTVVRGFGVGMLVVGLAAACGGRSIRREPPAGEGEGTAGGVGTDPPEGFGCGVVDGRAVRPGETTYDPTWCETCLCNPSTGNGPYVTCSHCDATCVDERGYTMGLGTGALLDDGCTACQCTLQGWECDTSACEREARCNELPALYAQAAQEARRCEPGVPGQCGEFITSTLACGCTIAVNDPAFALLLAEDWKQNFCGGDDPVCVNPCAPTGLTFGCGSNGYCVPM